MDNQAADNLDGLDNLNDLLRPVTQLHINKLDKDALNEQLIKACKECDADQIISLFHNNSSSDELTAQEVITIYCTYLLNVINTDIGKLDQALSLSRTLSRSDEGLLARMAARCVNLLTRYAPDTKVIRKLIVELSGYNIPVKNLQDFAMIAARQGKARTFSILNDVIGQWETDTQGVLMFWMLNTSLEVMNAVHDQPVIGINALTQAVKRNPETLCGVIHACLGSSVSEYRSQVIEYILYNDPSMGSAIKSLMVKYGTEFENYQMSLMTPTYGTSYCLADLMKNGHKFLTAHLAFKMNGRFKTSEIKKALGNDTKQFAPMLELIDIARKSQGKPKYTLRMKRATDPVAIAFNRGNDYLKDIENLKHDIQGQASEADIILALFYATCLHGLDEGILHDQLGPIQLGSLNTVAVNAGKGICSQALNTIKLMLSEDKGTFHAANERKVRITP